MFKQAERDFERMDVNAITSDATPDFTMTSMGKTENLKQSRASLRQWFSMMKKLNAKFTLVSVRVMGNTAIVKDRTHFVGLMKPMGGDKKPHKMEAMSDETCTFVRRGGKWLMKSIVSSNEKMLMDGKPFTPPGG